MHPEHVPAEGRYPIAASYEIDKAVTRLATATTAMGKAMNKKAPAALPDATQARLEALETRQLSLELRLSRLRWLTAALAAWCLVVTVATLWAAMSG